MPRHLLQGDAAGDTELKKSVTISEKGAMKLSSIRRRISCCRIASSRRPFRNSTSSRSASEFDLPDLDDLDVCLSGPFEMVYSLIAQPKLLFSEENYSPILCASALLHSDPRMVMMFKSYGPHLEFWLMTQMLTPTKTQVSEQWAGGITIFKSLCRRDGEALMFAPVLWFCLARKSSGASGPFHKRQLPRRANMLQSGVIRCLWPVDSVGKRLQGRFSGRYAGKRAGV